VIKLNPEICFKLRDARRTAGLSQSVVAAEVGCKQSALSMFEQGNGTKLNEEVITALSKKFGVSLTEEVKSPEMSVSAAFPAVDVVRVHGFCPNAHCPSNKLYEVDGRTYALPDRLTADPVGGRFCAMCGEVLEKKCPNCGAPVHDGAVCSLCGDPYVACC